MITIRNNTKRSIVLNLDHRHACSPTHCTCGRMKVGVQHHDKKSGERHVRAVNKRVPVAVTIMAKGTKGDKGAQLDVAKGLHDNVAKLPQVKKLVQSGAVTVAKQEPEKPKAEAVTTPDAPTSPSSATAQATTSPTPAQQPTTSAPANTPETSKE